MKGCFVKFSLFLSLSAVMLMNGCASYDPKDLQSLNYEIGVSPSILLPSSNCDENVKVYAASLSSAKTRVYFNRDIGSTGYKAIQFTVVNDSAKAFLLKNSNINLSIADPDRVAKLVHTSTGGRATAYGIGALVFLPLAIPAVVDGMKSSEANKQLDADFSERCGEICLIPPHSTKNHVIFVHKGSYSNSFGLSLIARDDATLRLDYDINL